MDAAIANNWWDHTEAGRDAFGQQVEKSDELAVAALWEQVDYIRERGAAMRMRDRIHTMLYSNRHESSAALASEIALLQAGASGPIRLNVTRSTTDTLTSRLSKNLAVVQVATENGDWTLKRRARRLSRFLMAKLTETNFIRLAPQVFRDACVRGTGILHVTSEGGEIVVERVPKHEIHVDELEARYGKPRTLHHTKKTSKAALAAKFDDPEIKHAILMHSDADGEPGLAADPLDEAMWDTSDQIQVCTSYHLPDAAGRGGKRVVSIRGKVLEITDWNRPTFPYVFFHFSPPEEGFWGTGLVEELAAIQWSIDDTIRVLEEGFRLGAPMKVFLERGSRIIKTQLNNRVGAAITYSGRPPEIRAPSNPVSQQQINWLLQLFEWAYQISGISLMSATSQKPGGDLSGVALRTLHDFETVRFAALEMAYQTMFVDVAELMIYEAKEIYELRAANDNLPADKQGERLYPDLHAKWVRRNVVQKIKWSDVDISPGNFKLKLKPQNFIVGTDAHQLQRVTELAGAGLVPSHWLLPLMDRPDLERFYRLQAAMWSYVEWLVEEIMDGEGELPAPVSESNLELVIEHVKAAYLDAITDEAPPDVRGRFVDFLSSATAKNDQAKKVAAMQATGPVPPPPAGPPGMPPGPGGVPIPGGPPPIDPSMMGAAA